MFTVVRMTCTGFDAVRGVCPTALATFSAKDDLGATGGVRWPTALATFAAKDDFGATGGAVWPTALATFAAKDGPRPPAGLVVPSRFMIFSAAALRAGSRLAMAAFSEATVPVLYRLRVYLLAGIYLPFLAGLAVLALSLKALAVGAPLAPTLRIFSPEPAAMRAFLAWMLAYRPGFMGISTFSNLLWHVRRL